MSSFERLVSSRALKSFLSQSVMIIATSFCCYLGEGVLIMVMVISVPDVTWALPALLQQQIDSIVSRAIVGSLCLACLKGCSLAHLLWIFKLHRGASDILFRFSKNTESIRRWRCDQYHVIHSFRDSVLQIFYCLYLLEFSGIFILFLLSIF